MYLLYATGIYLALGFLLVPQIMHAPKLMNLLQIEPPKYLQKHVRFNFWYGFFYDLHQFFATSWILLGGLQFLFRYYRKYDFLHHFLGYLYLISASVSPLCGLIMLSYRPKLIGESMTEVVLMITLLRTYYVLFRIIRAIRAGKVLEHRAWAFRSWYISLSSIQSASLVTFFVAIGVEMSSSSYRAILVLSMITNLAVMELGSLYLESKK